MLVTNLALQIARGEISRIYVPAGSYTQTVTNKHQLFPSFARRGEKCLWYDQEGNVIENIGEVIEKLLPNAKNYRRDTQRLLNSYNYQAVIVKVMSVSHVIDIRKLESPPEGFESLNDFYLYWWRLYATHLQEYRLVNLGWDFSNSQFNKLAQAQRLDLKLVKKGNI